jgi:hypothetical protein
VELHGQKFHCFLQLRDSPLLLLRFALLLLLFRTVGGPDHCSHKSVRVKTRPGSRISTRADNSVRHSPRWNSRSGTNRARGYIFLFYQRLAELQAQIQPIQPKPIEAHIIEPVTDQPALPSNETIPGSGAENGLPEREELYKKAPFRARAPSASDIGTQSRTSVNIVRLVMQ